MDIPKLIDLVKQRPELYRSSSLRFCAERKHLWKEIAIELDGSANACRDRWNNIRKLYRKYMIKLTKGEAQVSKYKFADQLSFLDPHLNLPGKNDRQPMGNYSIEDDSCNWDSKLETESEIDDLSNQDTRDTQVTMSVDNLLEEPQSLMGPALDIRQFCMSLAPMLKSIDEADLLLRNDIKLEIFKAVVDTVKESQSLDN